MPVENAKTVMKVRAGRVNFEQLAEPTEFHPHGRLPQPVSKSGSIFDPNPAPKQKIQNQVVSRGYQRGSDGIWRVNYSPEIHQEMLDLSAERKKMGKASDFVVELYEDEARDFDRWLKERKSKPEKKEA